MSGSTAGLNLTQSLQSVSGSDFGPHLALYGLQIWPPEKDMLPR